MTGDELTPERLDAILDGREPATDDAARDVLALAAALREAAPGAGGALRARVHALPQPEPRGRVRRLLAGGWRGRLLVAAPALSAVIVAAVAIGVLGQSSGSDSARIALEQRDATTQPANEAGDAVPPVSAPNAAAKTADTRAALTTAPLVVRVAKDTLTARLADIRRLVQDAGGAVETSPASPGPAALLTITVPGARSADILRAIVNLGVAPETDALSADADQNRSGAARVQDANAHVAVLLTEAP